MHVFVNKLVVYCYTDPAILLFATTIEQIHVNAFLWASFVLVSCLVFLQLYSVGRHFVGGMHLESMVRVLGYADLPLVIETIIEHMQQKVGGDLAFIFNFLRKA